MKSQPLLSVLMPVYNCANYIVPAVESILSQTFKDFEFIIIDDGSTDDTICKISEYNDPRITVIKNKIQKGICECLNYGISISNGKYIARMDGDDISHNLRFQHQIFYMEENPSVGILGTWYNIFGTETIVELPVKHESIVLDMLEYSPLAHPTVFIRASLIKNMEKVYNSNYVYAEDYELWSRLMLKTQLENLPICLFTYRKHDYQSSSLYSLEQKLSGKKVRLNILKKLCLDFEIDLNNNELIEFLDDNVNDHKLISRVFQYIDKLESNNLELKIFNSSLLNKKLNIKKMLIVKYIFKKQNLLNKLRFMNRFISVIYANYRNRFAILEL